MSPLLKYKQRPEHIAKIKETKRLKKLARLNPVPVNDSLTGTNQSPAGTSALQETASTSSSGLSD